MLHGPLPPLATAAAAAMRRVRCCATRAFATLHMRSDAGTPGPAWLAPQAAHFVRARPLCLYSCARRSAPCLGPARRSHRFQGAPRTSPPPGCFQRRAQGSLACKHPSLEWPNTCLHLDPAHLASCRRPIDAMYEPSPLPPKSCQQCPLSPATSSVEPRASTNMVASWQVPPVPASIGPVAALSNRLWLLLLTCA